MADLTRLARGARGQQTLAGLEPVIAARCLFAFVLVGVVCQLALLFDALASLRVVLRAAPFLASLAFLAVIPGRTFRHPARPWAVGVIVLMGLFVLHPTTNSLLSALAQGTLYLAILAPLFWAGRLPITPEAFKKLLLLLWGFYTLSAIFGVLQVYYPDQFSPRLANGIAANDVYAESLRITLASGQRVFRPMGLTDTPGGAAGAGLYAALLGLGFVLSARSLALRGAALVSIGLGLFCIYLSQVRVSLVMYLICAVAFAGVLFWRGEVKRFLVVCGLLPAAFILSLLWALAVGGDAVKNRLETLTEKRFDEVYYSNRGTCFEYTVTRALPQHPFGAGPGRWGMMCHYFGNPDNTDCPALFAEIQWTGWVYDGGLPLVVLYCGALAATLWAGWRVVVAGRRAELGSWAALLLAYNIAVLACTFSYPLFISQSGMEFWLLNACLARAALGAGRPAPIVGAGRSFRGNGSLPWHEARVPA